MNEKEILVPKADLNELIEGTNRNHKELVEQNKLLEERNLKLIDELEKQEHEKLELEKLENEKTEKTAKNNDKVIELLESQNLSTEKQTKENKELILSLKESFDQFLLQSEKKDDDILKNDFQHFTDLSIVFFLYMIVPFLLTIKWLSKFFDKTI